MTTKDYEMFKKMYLTSFTKTYKNGSKEQRKLLLQEIKEQPKLSDNQKKHIMNLIKSKKTSHRRTKKVLTYKVLGNDLNGENKSEND
jgi:hypothetical protein